MHVNIAIGLSDGRSWPATTGKVPSAEMRGSSATEMYPMQDGGPIFRPRDIAVIGRWLWKKVNLKAFERQVDYSETRLDWQLPFDERPPCVCGATDASEVLIARDGNRIVECRSCGLWFTSPRPARSAWETFLSRESEPRNIEMTERRLKHGVALARNLPATPSFWWRIRRRRAQVIIRSLVALHGSERPHIHDVGCAVGYFIKAAVDLGYPASGNDLNRYAVTRAREALGLDVHYGTLPALLDSGRLQKCSADIVSSHDVIEHVWDPVAEIRAAHNILRPGGILWLETFAIDSDLFHRLGKDWSMLTWNHTYHFSSTTLSALVRRVGFSVEKVQVHGGAVEVVGRKA